MSNPSRLYYLDAFLSPPLSDWHPVSASPTSSMVCVANSVTALFGSLSRAAPEWKQWPLAGYTAFNYETCQSRRLRVKETEVWYDSDIAVVNSDLTSKGTFEDRSAI